MATCPHLMPNTADWHAWNVGILLTNLQALEFSARITIATRKDPHAGVNLLALQPGQSVPEDPVTNFDQLTAVLTDFNSLASAKHHLNVASIVSLRDQLAHGRIAANIPPFPLTLLKFGRPANGMVLVQARLDMTEAWFIQQRTLVDNALQAVAQEQLWRRP